MRIQENQEVAWYNGNYMDFSGLLIPSFIAGLLTFFAPCTLPLVPGYLGFISGVSLRELNDPSRARYIRSRILMKTSLCKINIYCGASQFCKGEG